MTLDLVLPPEQIPQTSPSRPNKRVKTSNPPSPATASETAPSLEIPVASSDTDSDDSAAVRKYENQRKRSLETGTFTSSIYVDAFNLTLDTVLREEAYLFTEEEAAVFARYRQSLGYEAQHLYVRLFLRKTNAWFRINKLQYPHDIADMAAACKVLQRKDVAFADTDRDITLEALAGLLSLEELKAVAKDAKCTGSNKAQLISALKLASRAQGGLQARGGQLKLSFDHKGNYVNREDHYVKKMLAITGPCIRLSELVTTLFGRVHLVFYRSTEWTEKSLSTVILSRTQKRNFPPYIVSRTSNIFPTRKALLDFEAAIKLQAEVDDLLEALTEGSLLKVLGIFEETYPLWEELVKEEAAKTQAAEPEEMMERIYLRRFNAAWVYTRIIHKGVHVLGRFKQFNREHSVLCALLAQKYFQPARRGGWYQRKALIEENYMAGLDSTAGSKEALTRKWRKAALATCEAGLQDPQTHLIFHHDLEKRIMKLESRLRVPKREQHDFGHTRLRKPSERVIFGVRLNLPEVGRKTLWRDPEDTSSECSVEEMCLSVYRAEGWKGFHCEGSIVRTLFAYLFFDILFLYLPNVFETEFQTCPLDLFTDSFYPARASEINHRLVEIANGHAKRIVRDVWERNRERETCVIGLDWRYAIEDLEEIVECFPHDALATVCKVLCQEYRQRGSGLPDLFLWKYGDDAREVLFSEVKSENDRLSDTQRLWIHVLSGAGVKVELCSARAKKEVEE
ncbi:VRR-NUC domain-containing protein [Sphaerosporella brunnea]|uniref:Fanconi-associated nuclease n=1 Tax=Sphaerosporella brunnea TaxID=1250544 RepID=A0A5J5F741_9PEZI|nr:VRR-NUC domain-containing protein [Sphaerosporella brunnea]